MDGSFRLGPVAPGSYDVALRLPEVVTKSSRSQGERRTLARLDLVPGDLESVVFDAREFFPARLAIRATLAGRPLADQEVFAITGTGDQEVCLLDETGNGSLLLFPASYRLSLTDPADTWIAATPAIEVPPGSETSFDFGVELYSGTLRILDAASGAPLTDRTIRLGLNQPWMHELSLKTDANGELPAALPLNEYWVADGRSAHRLGPFERVIVGWGRSGPVPSEIRLTPVTEDD